MEELKMKEGESKLSYFKRITDNKNEYDLDYAEWGELLVGERKYSSENCRKAYYIFKKFFEQLDNEEIEKLPKNKMEEVIELIGELDIKKMEVKSKTSQLNKIKREFVKTIEISNDIKECLLENKDSFPKFEYEPIIDFSNNKLIVQVSDWHVGYVISNCKGNYYNYEIAKKRLNKLLLEIDKTCRLYNINTVIVVNCGDIIENLYMRQNQSYECEFDLSHQITYASKLLFSFITEISSKKRNVEVYSVGGNHSRMASNKDANIEGDNANVIINENLKTFVELSENKRVHINDIDYKDDSANFKVNGMNVKVIHGDNRVSDKKKLFDSESTMDDIEYKLVLRGHDHNFNMHSQNNGGYVVTSGSLFGYNPYSVKKMSCTTNASQTLIVVNENDIECIKDINLQIV